MSVLTLCFKGMVCLIDGRQNDPFAKRVVMPRDTQFVEENDTPHIPYVEIEADDLRAGASVTPSKTYTRGEGVFARSFHRFDLDAERVTIASAAQGNGLVVVPTFDERIPKMTLVCPDCPPNPRPECFLPAPPASLVPAYFDIRSGYLNAGALEAQATTFDEGSNWPSRRLAQWAQLELPIHGDRAEIVIERYDATGTRTIPLRTGAGIVTIGNGREEDIEELSTSSNRRAHFDMYYELGTDLPEFRPRPTIPMSAIRACAPTNWP